MKNLSVAACFLFFGACAQQPSAISPVSIGGAYDNTSCRQAKEFHQQESKKVPNLVKLQKNAAAGDAVGVFLIGLPMSSMSGADLEGEIAATKGKIIALEAKLDACGISYSSPDWQ